MITPKVTAIDGLELFELRGVGLVVRAGEHNSSITALRADYRNLAQSNSDIQRDCAKEVSVAKIKLQKAESENARLRAVLELAANCPLNCRESLVIMQQQARATLEKEPGK